jgi:hypothetical protein
MLEARKKQHHTKDLPIDITEYVKYNGGSNLLEIYINLDPSDATIAQYAFAIEVVNARSYRCIIEECKAKTIASEDGLKAITDSLNRAALANDDDDIIIETARTCITIYDPIGQGKICDLPARGKDCKHRECFDLLTFLRSRPREQPHWPSDPDSWKCPICLADVRPQHIVIDGFLKEVRDKLVSGGMSKVRQIVVDSDGSWVPKIEEGVPSERSTPEATGPAPPVASTTMDYPAAGMTAVMNGARGPSAGSTLAPPRKRATVIDLSDDD